MNLAINNIIEATDHDARTQFRVKGLKRDTRGFVTEVSLIDCNRDRMPDVFPMTQVKECMDRGDWVLLGEEQETEFDLKQRHIRSLDDLSPERRPRFESEMNENLRAIKPVLDLGWGAFDQNERGAVLAELDEKHLDGKSPSGRWITRLLRRYWRSGNNPYSLGPQNHRAGAKSRRALLVARVSGQPSLRTGPNRKVTVSYPDGTRTDRGGNGIPLGALNVIENLVSAYFDDPFNQSMINETRRRWKGLPWHEVTKSVNRGLGRLPTFRHIKATRRQVAYLGEPLVDQIAVLRRAQGYRHTNMNNRRLDGDYRDVGRFAGQRFEADTFLVDLHLVEDMTGQPIGRLRVYLIVDVFSGMVVGVYMTVNEVDNAHVGRALHAAFAPKVDYCKLFGLEIQPQDWPCEGLPEIISADNKELVTTIAQYLPELVDTGIARPYHGDDKGTVEVNSSLIQSGHVILYGEGVTKGPKLRCTDDPAKQATARVSTFMRELLRWVVYTHNHRPMPRTREIPAEFLKTKLNITPFNLWNWSRRKQGGVLRRYKAATMMPRLLPAIEANITRRGIEVDGLFFELPKELDKLRAASTCASLDKVRIHLDQLSTGQVYLVPPGLDATPACCPLTQYSREQLGLSWPEKKIRDRHVEQIRELTVDDGLRRDEVTWHHQREALLKDAKDLKEIYGSKRARSAVAGQICLDAVKDYQATSDDKRMGAFIHAPFLLPEPSPIAQNNAVPPPVAVKPDDETPLTDLFDT